MRYLDRIWEVIAWFPISEPTNSIELPVEVPEAVPLAQELIAIAVFNIAISMGILCICRVLLA